jgi:Ca2+-binding EF-hand superfamily protein
MSALFLSLAASLLVSSSESLPASGGPTATLTQATDVMRKRLMRFDANKDGRLSRSEFESIASARTGQNAANRGKMFDRLDQDRDGALQKQEIDRLLAARVRRLDRNQDGQIDREERMAVRQGQRN